MNNLPIPRETMRLMACEAVIAKGINTFIEVGAALLEIRDRRLYRGRHKTFETYCKEKWGMGRSMANKTISAAQVIQNLGTIVSILPKTESQARELSKISPARQKSVWNSIVKMTPPEKITARVIRAEVQCASKKPVPTE